MAKGQPSPDLTGHTFGLWTVVERDHDTTEPGVCYICVCMCGLRKTLRGTYLTTGRTTGCRVCHSRRIGYGTTRRIDLVGEKFGDWMVLAFSHVSNSRAYWTCVCGCGLTRAVNGVALRSGESSSCAPCARKARARAATDS